MEAALTGLVGVVAGALTTGGVQSVVEWRRGRNEALASSRIVAGVLDDFLAMLEDSERSREWVAGMHQLDRRLSLWEEHEPVVARATDSFGFGRLHAAFAHVRHVQLRLADPVMRQLPAAQQVRAIVEDPSYAERVLAVRRGQCIASAAGRTLSDRAVWSAWRERRLDSRVDREFGDEHMTVPEIDAPLTVRRVRPVADSESEFEAESSSTSAGWS